MDLWTTKSSWPSLFQDPSELSGKIECYKLQSHSIQVRYICLYLPSFTHLPYMDCMGMFQEFWTPLSCVLSIHCKPLVIRLNPFVMQKILQYVRLVVEGGNPSKHDLVVQIDEIYFPSAPKNTRFIRRCLGTRLTQSKTTTAEGIGV